MEREGRETSQEQFAKVLESKIAYRNAMEAAGQLIEFFLADMAVWMLLHSDSG